MGGENYRIVVRPLDNPQFVFAGDAIERDSIKVVQSVALVGQELRVDTFSAVVRDDESAVRDVVLFRSTDSQLIYCGDGSIYAASVGGYSASGLVALPYGTPVWYFDGERLVGKFYLKKADRLGKNKYKLSAVSAVELLDKMTHGGGLYMGATFGDVLKNILRKEVE